MFQLIRRREVLFYCLPVSVLGVLRLFVKPADGRVPIQIQPTAAYRFSTLNRVPIQRTDSIQDSRSTALLGSTPR